MLDVVGPEQLVVIANTGDDIEIYGGYVSPDPDLVTFWLADRIDERGWGLHNDTFKVMDGLRELGIDVWFNLGDADLAIAIRRAVMLDHGARLTEAQAQLTRALDVHARVLPMSDEPVRTRVLAQSRWWPFQEFMIKGRGGGPVEGVEFAGASRAPATPEVLKAIAGASAIVLGPSNPFISIAPILAVAGMRTALDSSPAKIVAVSPLVNQQVLKGPTDVFMTWAGVPLSSDGIATVYEGLIDGLVADENTDVVPTRQTAVLLDTPANRRRVAEETLRFAQSLG